MDMIITYKIVHGQIGIQFSDLFTYRNSATRTNGYKLFKQSCSRSVRLHSFSQPVVNDWDSLPANIVNAPDMVTFKTLLDSFWIKYRYIVD